MGPTVVVIGGGACFLAERQEFRRRVIVIERDPTYRQASSALSASAIRQ